MQVNVKPAPNAASVASTLLRIRLSMAPMDYSGTGIRVVAWMIQSHSKSPL